MKKILISVLFIGSLALPVAAQEATVPDTPAAATIPEPTAKVISDFADLLSDAEEDMLAAKIKAFYDSTSTQLAVITVPVAYRGLLEIEDYSLKIAEKWKIGTKGKNNGVIFLIVGSKSDTKGRGVRFEVGYGLEGSLTDALSKRIQSEIVVPELKAGNYFAAVSKGADAVIAAVKGEFAAGSDREGDEAVTWFVGLFMIPFLVWASGLIFGVTYQVAKRGNVAPSTGNLIAIVLIAVYLAIAMLTGAVFIFALIPLVVLTIIPLQFVFIGLMVSDVVIGGEKKRKSRRKSRASSGDVSDHSVLATGAAAGLSTDSSISSSTDSSGSSSSNWHASDSSSSSWSSSDSSSSFSSSSNSDYGGGGGDFGGGGASSDW